MNFDGVNKETNDCQTASNTENVKLFDGASFSAEGLSETEASEKKFDEKLDARGTEVLKEFRGSEEFSAKKEELSQLCFGEVATLYDDKLDYLSQCTEKYKELSLSRGEVPQEKLDSAQQKWEEALKEYDVHSAVLGEKNKETEEIKPSVTRTIAAAVFGVVGAIATPEELKEHKAYEKYIQIEQANKIEAEKGSRLPDLEIAGSSPEPPSPDNEEDGVSLSYDFETMYSEKQPEYQIDSVNVTAQYDPGKTAECSQQETAQTGGDGDPQPLSDRIEGTRRE